MIKPVFPKTAALLFALAMPLVLQAQMTYAPGDILVGFQASSGTGNASNYVFNLGQGHAFRSATATVEVGTIGADLESVYGIGWFNRPEVQWTIAGVRSNATFGADAGLVVNGDPARTLYISKAASGLGTSTPNAPMASGSVTTGANKMIDAQNGFVATNGFAGGPPRTPTAGSGGRGVIQGTGDINSWSSVAGASPFGVFTGSVKQSFGTAGSLSYQDLYRILGRNDLAGTVEPAAVGASVLQGTFTINASGVIKFEPPSTAVSGYDIWANSYNLTGTERAFDADLDGDGLDNGAEFVVGGHPRLGTDADKMPTLGAPSAGFAEFVFRRTDASAYLTSRAEYDADLQGTWTPAVDGTGGVSVLVGNDAFGAGIDRVTVRIPASAAVLFARLRVLP